MKQITSQCSDFSTITAVIQGYFEGLYHGDVAKLSGLFHQDAWLKAPGVRRSLTQWLLDVDQRPTPFEQGSAYAFEILAIDLVQDQAMVKVKCPLFDFNYVDFLGLLKEQGQWLIVNKMYSDIAQTRQ
jgi:hypothetical protein